MVFLDRKIQIPSYLSGDTRRWSSRIGQQSRLPVPFIQSNATTAEIQGGVQVVSGLFQLVKWDFSILKICVDLVYMLFSLLINSAFDNPIELYQSGTIGTATRQMIILPTAEALAEQNSPNAHHFTPTNAHWSNTLRGRYKCVRLIPKHRLTRS